MRKEAGFTLVEALVTFAVLILLLATGLPPLQDLVQQRRADAVISGLQADVALARTTAIMNGHAVIVCPRTVSNDCAPELVWHHGWVVRAAGGANDDTDRVVRISALPAKLSLQSNRNVLRYRPDGTTGGSNQTIRACINGRERATLVINNSGRPRSQRTVPHAPC